MRMRNRRSGSKLRYLGPESVCRAALGEPEHAVATRICELPTVKSPIWLTPEARYDKPETVSGVGVRTEGDDAFVFPGLAPDVGCGYHLALIKGLPSHLNNWEPVARLLVDAAGVYSSSRRRQIANISMEAVLHDGIKALSTIGQILPPHRAEFIDQEADSTDTGPVSDEILLWAKEAFGCFLGHFLELRRVDEILDAEVAKQLGIEKLDCVMIVHSGSQGLHRLLQRQVDKQIDEDYGHRRLYGAPVRSPAGQARMAAAVSAENYARASRLTAAYLLLEAMSEAFRFSDGPSHSLSDICHSMIRSNTASGQVQHWRGIQVAREASNISYTDPLVMLLAGTKCTPSYLVTPCETTARNENGPMICHGTPETLSKTMRTPLMRRRSRTAEVWPLAYADTPVDLSRAQEFTLCTELILEFFIRRTVVRPVCRLQPFVNLQASDAHL